MAVRVRHSLSAARTRLDFPTRAILAIVVLSILMFWPQYVILLNITSTNYSGDNFPRRRSGGQFTIKSAPTNVSSQTNSQLNGHLFSQTVPPLRFHTCTISNQTVSFPKVPHFIIAGAQKCGTTALLGLLNEHPDIQGSLAPEVHFFDWHVPSEIQREEWLTERRLSKDLPEKDMMCALQKEYANNFNATSNKIFFEKTPSYLFLTKVPELISTICFWKPKIVVILRNPVDRALSHFRMGLKTGGRSFEELIDEEVQHLKLIGLSQAPLRTEHYLPNDPRFAVPQLTKSQSEDLHWRHYRKLHHCNFIQRGMYITQLKHWLEYFTLYDGNHPQGKSSLLVLNYEQFKEDPEKVFSRLLKFVGATPFVPTQGFKPYVNMNEHRRVRMLPETHEYLSALFRPYNDMLADTLGEEWRGVWT